MRLPVAALLVVALVAGCHRKPKPEVCQKTCDHVAELEDTRVRSADAVKLHELQEMNESADNAARVEIERLKKLLLVPRPKWEQTAEAREKATAERRAAMKRRYEAEGVEERRRTEEALKVNEAVEPDGKKRFEDAKREAGESLKKAHAASLAACLADCASRYTAQVAECLGSARELDDLNACGRGATGEQIPRGTK